MCAHLKAENFVNQAKIQKTLRFGLEPVVKTEDNLRIAEVLEKDREIANAYQIAKLVFDRVHKDYLDHILQTIHPDFDDIKNFHDLYLKSNKTDKNKKDFAAVREKLCKGLAKNFSGENYDRLFKTGMIDIALKRDDIAKKERIALMRFNKFFTYFTNYNTARKNLYSADGKSNSVAHRIFYDNLPKFIDNIVAFDKIKNSDIDLPMDKIKDDFKNEWQYDIKNCFTLDYFNFVLTQKGIDAYNTILRGDTGESKRKGLNSYINEYNQKAKTKLPKLKKLNKQILSEREKKSFIPEKFEDDNQMLGAVSTLCEYTEDSYSPLVIGDNSILDQTANLFENIVNYDLARILIDNGNLVYSDLSQHVYGKWSIINDCRTAEYDEIPKNNMQKSKNYDKYQENLKEYLNSDKALSVKYLQETVHKYYSIEELSETAISDYFAAKVKELTIVITEYYNIFCDKVKEHNSQNRVADDTNLVDALKNFLDAMKDLQRLIKPVACIEPENDTEDIFYSELDDLYNRLDDVSVLYDKVRNYITQKPYSTDKIQLNFNCVTLLNGWDKNKEGNNKAIILLKDNQYYIGILNALNMPDIDENVSESKADNCYSKIKYKLFPDFSSMMPKCSTQLNKVKEHFSQNDADYILSSDKFVKPLKISKKIFELNNVLYDGKKKFQIEYLRNTNDNNGYSDAVHSWISFCMDFLRSYKSTVDFNYSAFENIDKYQDYASFIDEINKVLYAISYEYISQEYVDECVNDGKLYLFRLSGKDFSNESKGRPNLNTLYWKMIFDESNMNDTVFKLNGGAHIYYRDKSDGKRIIHKKGSKLVNRSYIDKEGKRQHIPNKYYEEIKQYIYGRNATISDEAKQIYNAAMQDKSFIHDAPYDIEKDRRYYHRRYMFHCPVTINFKAPTTIDKLNLNTKVNRYIHNNNVSVIGIDRGERNLIYATVVASDGKIIKQKSFNIINNVDYFSILDDKQKARDEQRKNWKSISNIKDFKAGYLSLVVHEIAMMMYEYNAIVVLEDLNCGFKNSRKKVEKQVYQNFEKALIDKLNYFVVDKTLTPEQNGSVLRGLQLTHKIPNLSDLQNQCGFVFYVPAWNTSKIDPSTGFVNLLDTRYKSMENTIDFLKRFEGIVYNEKTDVFEFSFDYSKFEGRAKQDFHNKWTISTQGSRLKNVRVEGAKGYETCEYNPTAEMKKLLEDNSVEIGSDNILPQIISACVTKEFAEKILEILRMTLQMRNSRINSTDPNDDYIISPVITDGKAPFDSRNYSGNENAALPGDADANGAYNIARKGMWLVEQLKNATDEELDMRNYVSKHKMTNKQWLEFTQKDWAEKYGNTIDHI